MGGQCPCKPNVSGRQCEACTDGFKEFPNCKGSKVTLFLIPLLTFLIKKEFWFIACDCNILGVKDQSISCADSGQCNCKDTIEGMKCDHCKDNFYGFPTCSPCQCHVQASNGLDCTGQGICSCKQNVAGDKCDQCRVGYKGHPTCDQCDDTYFGYPSCKGSMHKKYFLQHLKLLTFM